MRPKEVYFRPSRLGVGEGVGPCAGVRKKKKKAAKRMRKTQQNIRTLVESHMTRFVVHLRNIQPKHRIEKKNLKNHNKKNCKKSREEENREEKNREKENQKKKNREEKSGEGKLGEETTGRRKVVTGPSSRAIVPWCQRATDIQRTS